MPFLGVLLWPPFTNPLLTTLNIPTFSYWNETKLRCHISQSTIGVVFSSLFFFSPSNLPRFTYRLCFLCAFIFLCRESWCRYRFFVDPNCKYGVFSKMLLSKLEKGFDCDLLFRFGELKVFFIQDTAKGEKFAFGSFLHVKIVLFFQFQELLMFIFLVFSANENESNVGSK